jgi:lysophospholipase L1-like esterase
MSSLSAAHAIEIPADDSRIAYQGRYAIGAAHQVILGFPGIVTALRVNSATLRVRMHASSGDVYFNLSVDGAAPTRMRLREGANVVSLLAAAGPGIHVVELTRRTEGWEGICEIQGFDLGSGSLMPAPEPPKRKLLFIGDSITCGEGTEEADDPESPGAERSNAPASFGMKIAARLGAQVHLVSYGGRGIIRDWEGTRATNNAPQFYELALPDDPKAPWDHARYVPDAVGICLGTNDFSQGIPDRDEFVNAYAAFVRKVQRDSNGAPVILIDSPILEDAEGQPPKSSICRTYLDEIVRGLASARVIHAPLRHYEGSPGDGHPTAAEHTMMADELEPVFRKTLGWSSK